MSSLNSVEMYDPEMDEWTMVSSMEKHRSASGVVVLDSQIYAIGGHDGLSIFDSVSFSVCYLVVSPRRAGLKDAVGFLRRESGGTPFPPLLLRCSFTSSSFAVFFTFSLSRLL